MTDRRVKEAVPFCSNSCWVLIPSPEVPMDLCSSQNVCPSSTIPTLGGGGKLAASQDLAVPFPMHHIFSSLNRHFFCFSGILLRTLQ